MAEKELKYVIKGSVRVHDEYLLDAAMADIKEAVDGLRFLGCVKGEQPDEANPVTCELSRFSKMSL